jgi:hypothetical protein
MLEEIVKDIYLNRSLHAHGRELLEALEYLLDWEGHGINEEQAWEKACQAVTRVRSDYNEYEYPEYEAKRKQGGQS